MKKTVYILLTVVILFPVVASAQNCDLNETALRHWHRAKAAINLAKEPADYKAAADEYLLAVAEAPDCADIYYNLGLCYEQLGAMDIAYYGKALEQFKKYLQLLPDAGDKKEVQGKIYEMEYAIENAVRQKEQSKNDPGNPENYIGRWQFHRSDGIKDDLFDIEIYKNEGYYIAKYVIIKDKFFINNRLQNGSETYTHNTAQLKFEDGLCVFSPGTKLFSRMIMRETGRQVHTYEIAFTMHLTYEDGKLKGKMKQIYVFEASGNEDYQTVRQAIEDGYGRKFKECSDCGTSDVYFTRQ